MWSKICAQLAMESASWQRCLVFDDIVWCCTNIPFSNFAAFINLLRIWIHPTHLLECDEMPILLTCYVSPAINIPMLFRTAAEVGLSNMFFFKPTRVWCYFYCLLQDAFCTLSCFFVLSPDSCHIAPLMFIFVIWDFMSSLACSSLSVVLHDVETFGQIITLRQRLWKSPRKYFGVNVAATLGW